jgi:hypothetical protein
MKVNVLQKSKPPLLNKLVNDIPCGTVFMGEIHNQWDLNLTIKNYRPVTAELTVWE